MMPYLQFTFSMIYEAEIIKTCIETANCKETAAKDMQKIQKRYTCRINLSQIAKRINLKFRDEIRNIF